MNQDILTIAFLAVCIGVYIGYGFNVFERAEFYRRGFRDGLLWYEQKNNETEEIL